MVSSAIRLFRNDGLTRQLVIRPVPLACDSGSCARLAGPPERSQRPTVRAMLRSPHRGELCVSCTLFQVETINTSKHEGL